MVVLFILISALLGASSTKLPYHNFFVNIQMGLNDVSGNAEAQTYNMHLNAGYNFIHSSLLIDGDFINTQGPDDNDVRFWLGRFRYEHDAPDKENRIFYAHVTESEPAFALLQRDSDDVGYQRALFMSKSSLWLGELGLRYSKTLPQNDPTEYTNLVRFFTSYEWDLASHWIFTASGEFLSNINDNRDYYLYGRLTLEREVSRQLSLQLNYLTRYQNRPFDGLNERKTDYTTFNIAAHF